MNIVKLCFLPSSSSTVGEPNLPKSQVRVNDGALTTTAQKPKHGGDTDIPTRKVLDE